MWPTQLIKTHLWVQTMFRADRKMKHEGASSLRGSVTGSGAVPAQTETRGAITGLRRALGGLFPGQSTGGGEVGFADGGIWLGERTDKQCLMGPPL